VLLSLSNVLVGGVIGGAWMCAATVRAGSHLEALTLIAPKHLPGEKPKVIGLIGETMRYQVLYLSPIGYLIL
jgi:hypothetical protein